MEYVFIGWYNDPKENHDKVWGIIKLKEGTDGRWGEHDYVSFWGRRGKKLQTKMIKDVAWHIEDVINKKVQKGYRGIDYENLNVVYPKFQQDLEKTAFWAMFKV